MYTGPVDPLKLDPTGCYLDRTGVTPADLEALTPRLDAARQAILDDGLSLGESGGTVPVAGPSHSAGFLDLPSRLLRDYKKQRSTSELHRMLLTAQRLRERVDRVVVLGSAGSDLGAKALMDACCDPYFNELSRGARGSRPRMYFAGNSFDNDAAQGLLQLLGRGKPAASFADRWALVVIDPRGGELETSVAFGQFRAALRQSCEHDSQLLSELIVPILGRGSRLFGPPQALGCCQIFELPECLCRRFSVLSAMSLFPAAVLGIDVVRLLDGAATMSEHFRTAPVGQNVVLDFAGLSHLLETRYGATLRVLSVWAKSLESTARWYDGLCAASLGQPIRHARLAPYDRTLGPHSPVPQLSAGRRDSLTTNLLVDRWRHDPLRVETDDLEPSPRHELGDVSLPDLMSAAVAGTNQAYRDEGWPALNIHLPRVDEASLGQLFQMLMLSSIVEGCLTSTNLDGEQGGR